MKKGDIKSTEELLEKRFSGVKRDINDPGYIEIEYSKKKKEKKESVFSRPAMQLAGAFLAALIVGGGTFGALKYLEYRGAQIAGQSGNEQTGTSAVTGTDDTPSSDTEKVSDFIRYDRLILFIDPDSNDSVSYGRSDGTRSELTDGETFMKELGISIERNQNAVYTSYTLITKNGETGRTKYPGFMEFTNDKDGYTKKVIVLKDAKKDEIKVMYVTEENDRPVVRIITDDMAGGAVMSELDISALSPYMGDVPYYLYLDFESSVKTAYPDGSSFSKILLKVMYCTEAITQFSYYDCEKAFAVNIVDNEFVLGEEYTEPEIPDLSDMVFTVSTGNDSCRAAFIGSFCEDITAVMNYDVLIYDDPKNADIQNIFYNGTLDLSYDTEKTGELFGLFDVSCYLIYDDNWNLIWAAGDKENAMEALDIKKYSSVYIVFRCTAISRRNLHSADRFYYDFAVHVNQWAYDTYDIDVSPLPDNPDASAPVWLNIFTVFQNWTKIPDRLVSIKIPGRETVYINDEKPYEIYGLDATGISKIQLKYDKKAKLKNIIVSADRNSACLYECENEKELNDAIKKLKEEDKLKSCYVTFKFELTSENKDALYDEYTVYTYECDVGFLLNYDPKTDGNKYDK